MVAAFSQKNPLFIHIDKLGRVVIPQAVREKLRLRPGTTLALHVQTDEEIVLKVVPEEASEPRVVYREGVPVITGMGKFDVDIVELIKQDREERIQKILGLGPKE